VVPGLQREEDSHGFFACRLDNDFALGRLHHLILGQCRLMIAVSWRKLLVLVRSSLSLGRSFVGNNAWHSDNAAAVYAMRLQVLLCMLLPLAPASGRSVRAQSKQSDAGHDDHNQRYDKRDAPRLSGLIAPVDQRVVYGRHDEVGDAATCITKASSQSIGGTDNVLVEESSRPDLAWHEGTTQDADEESAGIKTCGIVDQRGKTKGYCSYQQKTSKHFPGSKLIAKWPRDDTDTKPTRCQCEDPPSRVARGRLTWRIVKQCLS